VFSGVIGCYQGAQSDTTQPSVYILKFEAGPNGTQGAQTTIPAGGSFTVPVGFLAYTQANIRVYGEGPKGISKFTVTGSASGRCSTNEQPNGQIFTSPSPSTVHFPDYVENAPPGTTRAFMAFHLDDSVLFQSCGIQNHNGAPPNLKYFLDAPATWAIKATAVNASGVTTTANFTINVQ
jgi:hypothetical protein